MYIIRGQLHVHRKAEAWYINWRPLIDRLSIRGATSISTVLWLFAVEGSGSAVCKWETKDNHILGFHCARKERTRGRPYIGVRFYFRCAHAAVSIDWRVLSMTVTDGKCPIYMTRRYPWFTSCEVSGSVVFKREPKGKQFLRDQVFHHVRRQWLRDGLRFALVEIATDALNFWPYMAISKKKFNDE